MVSLILAEGKKASRGYCNHRCMSAGNRAARTGSPDVHIPFERVGPYGKEPLGLVATAYYSTGSSSHCFTIQSRYHTYRAKDCRRAL